MVCPFRAVQANEDIPPYLLVCLTPFRTPADYKKPLPAGRDVFVTASIDRIEESASGTKKVYLVGSIVDKEDATVVYTQAKSLFIVKAVPAASKALVEATLAATDAAHKDATSLH